MDQHARTSSGFTVVALALSLLVPSPALAETFQLDWRIRDLYVTPATGDEKLATAEVGASVRVRCPWTAVVSESGNHNKTIEWQGSLSWQGAVKETRNFGAKYAANGKHYYKPGTESKYNDPWQAPNIYGTATNEFNGTGAALWTPTAPGKYLLRCDLATSGPYTAEKAGDRVTNSKSITYTVVPSTMKPLQGGAWPTEPIITQPAEGAKVLSSFKVVVTPRDPSKNCTQGGSLMLQREGKKLSSPMVAACAPGGTSFDLTWPPGTYQVRAKQFNKGTAYESAWSGWRTFTVLGASGRGK